MGSLSQREGIRTSEETMSENRTSRRSFLGLVGAVSSAGSLVAKEEAKTAEVTGNPDHLNLAMLQMAPKGADQVFHLKKAEDFIRKAAARGADIVLMPEMWNIGYLGFLEPKHEQIEAWKKQAVSRHGEWVGHFRKLARELGIAIGVTYLEEWQGGPRNTISIIDRHGEIVLTYAKVHTCDFAFEAALTPGDQWFSVSLDTAKGSVETGAMICYDREFPEAARTLMLKGAELVLVPNACLLDDLRLAQFRVRAHENAMVMAMTNYAVPFNNGRSVVYGAGGEEMLEGGEGEGVLITSVDPANLRDYRSKTIWGDSWRRPHRYGDLGRPHNLSEFKRINAYGKPFVPSDR